MLADLPRFHALVLINIELFWKCDVRLRMRETLVQVYLSTLPDGKKCFAPLPRTVYLVFFHGEILILVFEVEDFGGKS